jgi:ParB family chromosome partitioning protein
MNTPVEAPAPSQQEAPTSQDQPRSAPVPTPAVEPGDSGLVALPVDAIAPNPHQPRRTFDEQALRELADSILAAGLIQPVVVRPSDRQQGGYELIAGERRWRAARLAGLAAIPALVRDTTDQQSAEFALIENLQRADLNPIERAEGLQSLADRFGLSQSQLAERVGVPRPSIANLLRLLALPEPVRELIRAGELSFGHGKLLTTVADNKLCVVIAERCARAGWSVRKLEQQIAEAQKQGGDEPRAEAPPRPAHLVDLERRLADHLGTKVKISEGRKKGAGRLVIEFYDLDQFDGLMQRFGFEQG